MSLEMILLEVPRYAVKFIAMGVIFAIYLIIHLISISVKKSRNRRQQRKKQANQFNEVSAQKKEISEIQTPPEPLTRQEKLKSTTPLLQPTIVTTKQKSITIGRSPDNSIVISHDGRVSRHHCKIYTDIDNILYIEDMDSSNGTFVNGKSVKKFCIYKGDKIKVGDTQIDWENHFFQ